MEKEHYTLIRENKKFSLVITMKLKTNPVQIQIHNYTL